VWLGGAYNRWLIERILSEDDRIKSLIYLPFKYAPKRAERTVEELGDKKGVIGFLRDQHPQQAGASQRLYGVSIQ